MDFRITMLKNAAHPFGILRSKGINHLDFSIQKGN
jgi:hypothetical protein